MIYMLLRNRVNDFDRWKRAFDAQTGRAGEAGLKLLHLWTSIDDRNNAFFLLEVADIDRARAFLAAPESAEAGSTSVVIDGEYHFLQDPVTHPC